MISKILNTDPVKRYTIEDIRKHSWMQKGKIDNIKENVNSEGRDQEITTIVNKRLELHSIDPEYALQCVQCNIHNSITACYYLLKQQVTREYDSGILKLESESNLSALQILKQQSGSQKEIDNTTNSQEETTGNIPDSSHVIRSGTERTENEPPRTQVEALKFEKLSIASSTSGSSPPSYPGTSRVEKIKSRENSHPIVTSRRSVRDDKPDLVVGNFTNNAPVRPVTATASSYGKVSSNMNRRVRQFTVQSKEEVTPKASSTQENESHHEKRPSGDMIDIASTSTKQPEFIMSEMQRALIQHGILAKATGKYSSRCQKNGVCFDMNIAALKNVDKVYIVNIRRVAGDGWLFKQLRSKILATMKL